MLIKFAHMSCTCSMFCYYSLYSSMILFSSEIYVVLLLWLSHLLVTLLSAIVFNSDSSRYVACWIVDHTESIHSVYLCMISYGIHTTDQLPGRLIASVENIVIISPPPLLTSQPFDPPPFGNSLYSVGNNFNYC